jgi:Ca2+-binding EF-hand superfamily protein
MFRGLDQIASGKEIDEKIQQIVAQADRDNSGSLDIDEFVAWFGAVYTEKLDKEARKQFNKIDTNSSGLVSLASLKPFVEQVDRSFELVAIS